MRSLSDRPTRGVMRLRYAALSLLSRRRALASGIAVVLTACGGTLSSKVDQAMTGCVALRNADFVGGRGATSLDVALPDSLSQLADKIAYQRAFSAFESIAQGASDQVTLVCALELASHLKDPQVAYLLTQYSSHPDAAVAASAKRLLKTQEPLR